MNRVAMPERSKSAMGIRVAADVASARRLFVARLDGLGLGHCVVTARAGGARAFSLCDRLAEKWPPLRDTRQLFGDPEPTSGRTEQDLEREILVGLLMAPRPLEYPSYDELAAAVRIRLNIVAAAHKTQLAFDTVVAERPDDYWTYDEDRGFTILPGTPLIAALEKATQPDTSGRLYSFSCYRATEYVILLGIAQALARINPPLLERLQAQWETRAIKSGQFHEVFLYEYGSLNDPLPPGYYVPGDRIWFRNPDPHSSDIAGYEGSWVFYLGGGLFSNFWKRNQPYTLTRKCVELFHWRHGIYRDAAGDMRMDEAIVEARVRASLDDPAQVARILAEMARLRDPSGVYADGGCIDASREFPRWVCPGTADMVMPDCCGFGAASRGYAIPVRHPASGGIPLRAASA